MRVQGLGLRVGESQELTVVETLHLVPQGEGIRFRVSGLFVPAFLVATRLLSRLALFMEFSGACSVLEARTSGVYIVGPTLEALKP